MTGAGRIEVQLLGPLQVRRDGDPVDLGGPKQRAVLALLVFDVGRVVATGRLVDELWAGDPPASGIVTVQGYIAGLRRALEPGTTAAAAAVLATEPPGYVLRLPPEAVDRVRFERLVDAGAEALAAGRPDEALARLDEGLALFVGEPLADLAGEVFAGPVIARLAERHLAAVEDRVDARLALGHHRALVGELEALVAAHPLRERLAAQLVLALYRSDRQADALRAYSSTREALVEELGIDPAPALRELEARVLAQDPSLRWAAPATAAGAGSATASAPAAEAPRLVERDGALTTLASAWQQAQGGRTRLVLLEGLAGHGKTSVPEAFVATVDEGVEVAWGRCPDHDGAPALWAWRQVLRVLADDGPAPPPIDIDTDPASLFTFYDDLAAWLGARAGRGPCVVVLDDVHRADIPTLEALRYVVANVRSVPLLLVATLRPLPPGGNVAVDDALGALVRDRSTERVALDALSPAGTNALVAATTGALLDDEDLARFLQRSGGSPWMVAALARDAARLGGHVNEVPLPADMRSLGRRALAYAGPDGAVVAGAAGVLGIDFEVGEVARVADRDLAESLAAIEALAARHYILRDTDPRRYRWAAGFLGELAAEELPAADRATLHARAAEVLGDRLDRTAATDPERPALVERVVDHVIRSADAIVTDRGLQLLEDASGTDRARDDHSQELLERAARELEALPPNWQRGYAAARLRARRFDLAVRRHGLGSPESRAQADLILRPGWVDDRPARKALSLFAQCASAVAAADLAGAQRALDGFAADAADPGTYPDALRQAASGLVAFHRGEGPAAIELLAVAAQGTMRPPTEKARSATFDHAFALSHATLALALSAGGRDAEATAPMATALAEGSAREPWLLVYVQCLSGLLAVLRGEADVARRTGRDVTRFAEEQHLPQFAAWGRIVEAWGDGNPDRLRASADDLADSRLAVWRGLHHRLTADLLTAHGKADDAEKERDAAHRFADRTGLRFGVDASA